MINPAKKKDIMDFLDLVTSRESTRSFKEGEMISRPDLELCAEAGRNAPSACNSQPWKFVIIDDPETVKRISSQTLTGTYGMNSFCANASAFIAIVSEGTKASSWAGGKIMGTDFRLIDTGIACAHVVLAAEDLGIATCILGWFDEKKLKRILSIPRKKKTRLLIAMGRYPSGSRRKKSRKSFEKTVSFNGY